MIFNLLQAATEVVAEPIQQEMKLSLIDMASKGGWLMIVLLILSVIAIYIRKQVVAYPQGRPDRRQLHERHP